MKVLLDITLSDYRICDSCLFLRTNDVGEDFCSLDFFSDSNFWYRNSNTTELQEQCPNPKSRVLDSSWNIVVLRPQECIDKHGR